MLRKALRKALREAKKSPFDLNAKAKRNTIFDRIQDGDSGNQC